MKVPCFSLVVERLIARPESGMERFLVKVALAMQPAVYVPTERPPAQHLYIVTQGIALFRGKKLKAGDSWGAEDVLLKSRATAKAHRAVATTYLHALWIAAQTFDELKGLGQEFREAYMLVKLWATIYATGEAMVEDYRRKTKVKRIQIGEGANRVSAVDLEEKINTGKTKVVALRSSDGQQIVNPAGEDLFTLKFPTVDLTGHEIIREAVGKTFMYRVRKANYTLLHDGYSVPTSSLAKVTDEAIALKKRDFENKAMERRMLRGEADSEDETAVLAAQLGHLASTFQANTEAMGKQLAAMAKQIEALASSQKEAARSKRHGSVPHPGTNLSAFSA